MSGRYLLASILCAAAVMSHGVAAHGMTIYVPADYPTIQAGIDVASDGDTVQVASGTYVENIDFLGKEIVLVSEEGAEDTIIDGNQSGSVVLFENDEPEETLIEGFTLTNGTGTWDFYPIYGGGIYCRYGASPTIRGCTITENQAEIGGGIACRYSSPLIEECMVTWNTATFSSGISCYESSSVISKCIVSDNLSLDYYSGSAINCNYFSSMITNCSGEARRKKGR